MSNRRKEYGMVWVHKDFHQRLKIEAAKRNMKILDYTKALAHDELPEQKLKDKKRGAKGFILDF